MGQYSLAEAKPIAAPSPTVAKGAYRLEEAKPLEQDGGMISSPPPSRRDSSGDAVSGVMDGLKEAIKAIPDAVRHPLDSAYQMFEASKDQYEKAVKAAGPGRDNKGDVAGFIQHAVGMFPVLGPMASNLLDAVDSGADSYEVGKRAGNLLSLKVVPEITKKGIALAGKAVDVAPSPSGPRPPPPPSPVNVGKLMSTAKSGAVNVGVRVLEKAFGLPPGSGKIVKNIVEAVREEMAGKTTEVAPPTPTVVEAPPVASGTPVRPPLRGKQFGTFNDPAAPPLPAGVQPSGPVRPPVAAAAPAEMPALQQITEWLASRDGGTASRFTDPVVSEAPITKQTLGDIMDRLMKNRKVPAEVPAATVPAEVPPTAVETPVVSSATPAEVPAVRNYNSEPSAFNKVSHGDLVDGLKVRGDTPNTSSIASSFENYEEVPGVREVPFSIFENQGPGTGGRLNARTAGLADEISTNGEINPLIVVYDAQGPYILEGAHRFDALSKLGKKTFPARVVFDRSEIGGLPDSAPAVAAVETPQPATPAPSAAGKPVTAATLMEEVAKPDSFQELRDMIKERAGKKVPPFDWTDEAQFQEYQKALVEESNIYGNNRTTMADRVTRFMKKNGIEPTDSGIVRALNESAEDIAVSPTTGLKRPSFNAADHEVLFDMIKDRLETPTGGKPAASASAAPNPLASAPEVPKAAAKPRLDHGVLNLPLDKRGGGSINSQLDRYKADLAKAKKAADKEAVIMRRSDKAIARDLFTQHAQALAESTAAKRGIPVKDSIKLMDHLAKWEPKKLIKLLEKYQADNPKSTTVGELMEKAKVKK